MIVERQEELILNQLIHNKEYFQRVYPHLHDRYFQDKVERELFNVIDDYAKQYSSQPSPDSISILLNEKGGLTEEEVSLANEYIKGLLVDPVQINDLDFAIDETEKFCQDRSMYNAIIDSMAIMQGEDKTRTKNAIPDIMKDALRVSFNQDIGLDYDDVEERYNRMHREGVKIPFDIEALNVVTNGGVENKTLNCVLASTGVGKTIFMCHCAASYIARGLNVVYFTMEMAEEKIAQRIDANLFNIDLDALKELDKETFFSKFKKVVSGNSFLAKVFGVKKRPKLGKLFIKEFPTSTANMNHIRAILDDLKLKKDFVPDVIIIDYINICASTRVTPAVGTYAYVKAIAEEMRGLAVEYNVPVITATQTNRSGYGSSDIDMTDTSESIGLPETLDFFIALMTNDELQTAGLIAVKQLKNRYRDEHRDRYFTLGLDKPKMRFYHNEDWNQSTSEESKEKLVLAGEEEFGKDITTKEDALSNRAEELKKKYRGVKI